MSYFAVKNSVYCSKKIISCQCWVEGLHRSEEMVSDAENLQYWLMIRDIPIVKGLDELGIQLTDLQVTRDQRCVVTFESSALGKIRWEIPYTKIPGIVCNPNDV